VLPREAGRLALKNTGDRNKKLGPNSVLLAYTAGKVDEPTGTGLSSLEFVFKKSSDSAFLSAPGGQYEWRQLSSIIFSKGLDSVYQHGKFTKAMARLWPSVLAKRSRDCSRNSRAERAGRHLVLHFPGPPAKGSISCPQHGVSLSISLFGPTCSTVFPLPLQGDLNSEIPGEILCRGR